MSNGVAPLKYEDARRLAVWRHNYSLLTCKNCHGWIKQVDVANFYSLICEEERNSWSTSTYAWWFLL